jgi:hypothetical protein
MYGVTISAEDVVDPAPLKVVAGRFAEPNRELVEFRTLLTPAVRVALHYRAGRKLREEELAQQLQLDLQAVIDKHRALGEWLNRVAEGSWAKVERRVSVAEAEKKPSGTWATSRWGRRARSS